MKAQKCAIARLKKRADFLAAASGRRFRDDSMTVQGFYRKPDGSGLQIGFTVTKRVGNAVERNRIKRRLRAAVEQSSEHILGRDINVVVIARRSVLSRTFEDILNTLNTAFSVVSKQKIVDKAK